MAGLAGCPAVTGAAVLLLMRRSKTLVTHAASQPARFLGYEIKTQLSEPTASPAATTPPKQAAGRAASSTVHFKSSA
jgi:hypothetical protein